MIKHSILPFLFASLVSLCTLSLAAQDTLEVTRLGRRGTFRPNWALHRAPKAQDLGPGGIYFTGEKHQLVIFASFEDNPFLGDSATTIALWDKILNTKHLNEPPFVGSIHDYFYDQSYGQFSLTFDLQFVRVGNRSRYKSTELDDENSQYLVQDVINSLKQRDIEWNLYDWNGDGYVNQLLIIYAGQGSKYGGLGPSYDAIWPHQWWLSQHLKDRQQNIYCSPDTVQYLSKNYILDAYCAVQEISPDSTYGTFGTLCHEFTHCFGFPDFYYSGYNKTPHKWELMDYGNYCEEGFRPVGFSSHERWLMGWLTPIELTSATTVTDMPALSDQPVAYLIRNDNYPNEFYLLENRQKKGWDAELPGNGLLVFHIDYDPSVWLSGFGNTDNEQHYMIIPANNKTSRSGCNGWAYPYENNDELTDSSLPPATLWHANLSEKKLMSKPVTNITVNDSLVSFSFMASPTGLVQGEKTTDEWTKIIHNGQLFLRHKGLLYNLQGIKIQGHF